MFSTVLFYIFLILYCFYAYKITRWLHHSLNGPLSYFYKVDLLPENRKPFARLDRAKWSHFEFYFCAIFLLPWRMAFMVIFTIAYYLIHKICDKIWGPKNEQTPVQREIIRRGGIFARLILFCAGFYWISHKKAKIADYLPDYRTPGNKKACIIVSNHYSWLDIYYYISCKHCPSFLSKDEVRKYPFIGIIAIGLQSLFVDRNNRTDKEAIISTIRERTSLIKSGKNYPKILIFPEGTTTNGKYMISFKKGAFVTMDPIKIICLKYHERTFALSYDVIGDIYCLVFPFCQFYNRLTVTEFDVFDPEYLGPFTGEQKAWAVYASKVKEVMRRCLGVPNSEAGFEDKQVYYKEVRENVGELWGSEEKKEKIRRKREQERKRRMEKAEEEEKKG